MPLRNQVNDSGFPLQLAIANALRNSGEDWRLLYEEHAWKFDDDSGFIDLVIEDKFRTWLMNVECKRVRNTDWVFLRDRNATATRRHAKLWVSYKEGDRSTFDWVDVAMDPSSVESSQCIVRGQDSRSRPMLERTAATVVKSTEALAVEESQILSEVNPFRIYQNVIVTTANLQVCEIDVSNIDISTGEIGDDANFEEVPYVRFRKQLGAKIPEAPRVADSESLRRFAKSRESTVFVVNSTRFLEFLDDCELPSGTEHYVS